MSSDQDSEKVPKRVEEGTVVKYRLITSAAFVEIHSCNRNSETLLITTRCSFVLSVEATSVQGVR